jgi:hypothetical protein
MYIAEANVNEFMVKCDLCPAYKVYYSRVDRVESNSHEVYNYMLQKTIASLSICASENDKTFCAAVEAGGKLYVHKALRELSDGKNIIRVRNGHGI